MFLSNNDEQYRNTKVKYWIVLSSIHIFITGSTFWYNIKWKKFSFIFVIYDGYFISNNILDTNSTLRFVHTLQHAWSVICSRHIFIFLIVFKVFRANCGFIIICWYQFNWFCCWVKKNAQRNNKDIYICVFVIDTNNASFTFYFFLRYYSLIFTINSDDITILSFSF